MLDPPDSFKTFNEFFYRKLKPTACPVEDADDLIATNCRLMMFETVSEATRLWIKGRDFTIARLLGDTYKKDLIGGSLRETDIPGNVRPFVE